MVVVMLAAEDPSVDGHLASTPRRRGMDGNGKPSKANKKLVQARLPFKRLNPEPKESSEPKKICTPLCPEPGASDGENESDSLPLPVRHRPALVNGRGPLDGFMWRSSHAAKCMIVDLTEDTSNSSDASKLHSTTPVSASCPFTKDNPLRKDSNDVEVPNTDCILKTITLKGRGVNKQEDIKDDDDDDDEEEEEEEDEKKDGEDTASVSQLDTTQGSESEEEQEEPMKAEMSSHGNESMLSPSSSSSLSAVESSPELAKTEHASLATDPKTTPNTGQKNIKRRSLKSLQEQDERLRQRQERERQRDEARAAKEKKKEEARKLREEREKEKREKKEKEEREKLEKKEKEEKEKAEKLKVKEEQRKSKQEARLEEKRKKEEEKRVREEEKRLKEEKDRMIAEKSEITRFLQKPKTQQAPKTLASACGKFAPFEIKEHMCLAPLTRVQCEDSVLTELDQFLSKPEGNQNKLLKDWTSKTPRRSGPTKPRPTDTMRECVIEGPKADGVPDRKRYGHMKLLQFRENHRPAYWGTWSKRSSHISPRCPLTQDKELLDYEVDSDDEWEEEEPGESLSHSEGDDDDEGGENDDDDDDGFFVPHGYLSDGEGALEEEEEGGNLEKQKVRQKLKAREWDELMAKKKLKVLEAVVRGCVWEGEGPQLELLQPYAVCLLEPLPKADPSTPEEASIKQQRDEQLLSQLLPLLHGNVNSNKVIITEFQEFCRQQTSSPTLSSPPSDADHIPTRIRLKRLIKGNAVYVKRSSYRPCWYVHTEVLARFRQEALPVPCQWTYLTSGAQTPRDEPSGAATGSQGNSPTTPQSSVTTTPSSNKRKSAGSMSITKFMKKCADPEQTEAMETDGFQADTEDDDEEPDCVIVSTQSGSPRDNTSITTTTTTTEHMEVTPSDSAAVPLACPPAPTPATA